MCLCVKENTWRKIATHDIEVWKVLKNDNRSIVQGFQYKPNTLFRLRKKLNPEDSQGIYEGFHAYTNKAEAETMVGGDWKLVTFTIPKGAVYFLGICDEIVSTSIRSGNLKRCND